MTNRTEAHYIYRARNKLVRFFIYCNNYKRCNLKEYTSALIIDDDVDLCMTLRAVLRSSISGIHTANTLEEARRRLPELKPEVIFLDNNLPDGEGVSMVKEIKEQLPGTAIIFITAVDSAKTLALEYGVDVYLEKPLTFSAITGALKSLGANKQQLQ